MPTPIEILRQARHVVVQDFPNQDIPEALTRVGLVVTIYGGPHESDVVTSEMVDGAVVHHPVGRYPDAADLLCTYRPTGELDEIIAEALRLGARTIWRQSAPNERPGTQPDTEAWRMRVEQAGLSYVDAPSVAEVAQSLRA